MDVKDNVFFGVNYELRNGLSLITGLHLGRVTTVDSRLGVEAGGSVAGLGLTTVPTVSTWRRGWFYTIGLDPRILSQLFRAGGATTLPDR